MVIFCGKTSAFILKAKITSHPVKFWLCQACLTHVNKGLCFLLCRDALWMYGMERDGGMALLCTTPLSVSKAGIQEKE